MNVGFTGTQKGMSQAQKRVFMMKLLEFAPSQFHHGDCIGADADAHDIVRKYLPLCKIWIHPPNNPDKRAFRLGDESYPVLPYLDRNHAIVDATEVLLATPQTAAEQLRSGTWATIRYARKNRKRTIIIYPSGAVILF